LALHSGIEGFETDNAFSVWKTTGGKALGNVGRIFEPTQPEMLFDGMLECLKELPSADLNTLTFTELKGGKRIKISCEIGEFGFINLKGIQDSMTLKLNVQTGYDNQTSTTVFLSTYRLICENGMKGNTTEFNANFKNTSKNLGKSLAMMSDISKVLSVKDGYLQKLEQLSKRKITDAERNTFIQKVWGIDVNNFRKGKAADVMDQINRSVAIEQESCGNTAWMLLNAATQWSNHQAKASNTEDFIYANRGLLINEKAQSASFALLN